jgi:hypothetical protein
MNKKNTKKESDGNKAFRSQAEIVAKIKEIKDKAEDLFNTKFLELVSYLDYEHVRPYLSPEVTKKQWNPSPSDRNSVLAEMEKYMEFAWGKANAKRGLSAARSMDHYIVWTWMVGDEDRFGNLRNYQWYGKDKLLKICNYYGWDADKWDDGCRAN